MLDRWTGGVSEEETHVSHLEPGSWFDRMHLILALAQAKHAVLHPAMGCLDLSSHPFWVLSVDSVVSAMVANTEWLPSEPSLSGNDKDRIDSFRCLWSI